MKRSKETPDTEKWTPGDIAFAIILLGGFFLFMVCAASVLALSVWSWQR
jgi:high-affinity K+ transport system ATPase subunit B